MLLVTDCQRFADWAKFLGVADSDAFDIAADLLNHFGVEESSVGDDSMQYLNQGGSYDETLVLDAQDGLMVTTWGDWFTEAENAYCAEHGVIRCGYCGKFTDCAERWDETVCEHCGNCVAG